MTLGEIGINKYSTITVEVKPFDVPEAMALEDVIIKVQDYMSIINQKNKILLNSIRKMNNSQALLSNSRNSKKTRSQVIIINWMRMKKLSWKN